MTDSIADLDEKVVSETVMSDTPSEGEEEQLNQQTDSQTTESAQIGCTYEGTLSKWTNFIHGWQERFMILKDGTLSYYKSKNEKDIGCRGAISIQKATVKVFQYDDCRFDISVGDCVWYLRGQNKDERDTWVEALEAHILHSDSAYGSDNSLRKTGSVLSLGSLSLSSNKKSTSLREKIAEIETFRDILIRQIENLQLYFDNPELVNNFHAENKVLDLDAENANKETEMSTNNLNKDLEQIRLEKVPVSHPINRNIQLKNHQRHHSYSNIQFSHHNNYSKQHKRSSSHNSSNLEYLKHASSGSLLSAANSTNNLVKSASPRSLDFKGEAITFKATTASILDALGNCLDLMQQKEENFTKKLDLEIEKRRKLEELLRQVGACQNSSPSKAVQLNNVNGKQTTLVYEPDFYEEGPYSKIKEEEFFDAVDAMLDKSDQQEEEKRQLRLRVKELSAPSALPVATCDHPLWPEIDQVTLNQLYYARLEVGAEPLDDAMSEGNANSSWQLFAEEGEMRLYKREVEIDGSVCDPLKAVHTVKGITAHEVCHHFFSPDVRWDWENTLESMKVLEEINGNTLILHQIHKRVWPAAQRDTVFWSHIRRIPLEQLSEDQRLPNLKDVWIVCNNSTNFINVPLGGCLRMKIRVSMICETYIEKPPEVKTITRDHLKCKIIYCSTINPGGWAPATVLRALYKREYPKFLKRFTQYVIDAQEKKEILF